MPETNDQSASTASGPKTLARATDNPNLGLPVLASRSASHVAQGWRPDRHLPGHDRQELADKALLTIEQG
jgi:hypothetical protein